MGNIFSLLFSLLFFFLMTGCTSLIYWPDKYLHYHPDHFGVKVDIIKIPSMNDKTMLSAWKIYSKKNEQPENLVLFFHGNAENMTSHFANLVWLTEESFDLIVFDYRGYGLSEGSPFPKGIYEDGLTFLNYAYNDFIDAKKNNKYKRFIVYSQSLGGAIALRALQDFEHRSDISLLVLDSTFRSTREIAREKSNWLFSFLVSDSYSANASLDFLTMPILSIHSLGDDVVPFKLGEKLFNNLTQSRKKEFWKITNPGHSHAFHIEEGQYRTRFQKFVNEVGNLPF